MANYQFPQDLGSISSGHWILFESFEPTGLGTRVIDNSVNSVSYGTPKDVLFMFNPGGSQSTLTWSQLHEYGDIKLMQVAAGFAGVAQSSTGGIIPNIFGKAINPRAEVLYRNTPLRQFQMDFMMAPSSKQEATSMMNIIKTFRAAAAPTLMTQTYNSVFENPCEWRIRFFFRDDQGRLSENTNIPRISKSVITRIDVDYTRNAEWNTFRDGVPTSALLTMEFVEMAVVDSQAINQRGF